MDTLDGSIMDGIAPIVLFDGVCGLCNRSVQWLLKHDRQGVLRFAALQSAAGRNLFEQHALGEMDLSTVALIEEEKAHLRSQAALRILKLLGAPWSFFYPLILIPAPLRDSLYNCIAGHRYQWFGRLDSCVVPDHGVADRFLDDPDLKQSRTN